MGRCRNYYYDGKPLRSEEFLTEQNYFREDLCSLRSLFFGKGIVYGFGIHKQKGSRFILDQGMAIDEQGRILLNTKEQIFDIREVENSEKLTNSFGYLQILYQEHECKEKETKQTTLLEESFSLRFIDETISKKHRYFKEHNVYDDAFVRIYFRIPAYFADAGMMNIHLLVHKKTDIRMHFHFMLTSDHVVLKNEDADINLTFGDSGDEDVTFLLEKKETAKGKRGYLNFSSVEITINDQTIMIDDMTISFSIVHDLPDTIHKLLYANKDNDKNSLLLGCIKYHIDQEEWIIDEVISQASAYASRPMLNQQASSLLKSYGYQPKQEIVTLKEELKHNSGSFRMLLNEDETFYVSEEIAHGLGVGNVCVQAGIQILKSNELCFGNTSFFHEKEEEVEIASRVMMEEGTFQVACKVPRYHTLDHIDIVWFADKYPSLDSTQGLSLLRLEPVAIELPIFSSHIFTPIFVNSNDLQDVVFAIDDEHGGTIDEEGTFHAADVPGVYQISAKCHEEVVYAYVKVVTK